MGFAQRVIRTSRTHISTERRPRKAFPTTPKTFGEHLRIKRLEMGLTQGTLGEKLGVEKVEVGFWERDQMSPTEAQLSKLVGTLNMTGWLPPTIPTAD